MTDDERTAAIVEPARLAAITIDPELVALPLKGFGSAGHAAARAGSLPLLSHVLAETWERSRRGRMMVADDEAAGGRRPARSHRPRPRTGGGCHDRRTCALGC